MPSKPDRSARFFWGTAHVEPSREDCLLKKVAELERHNELSCRENFRIQEVIASQSGTIDHLRQEKNLAEREREDYRLRLQQMSLERKTSETCILELKQELSLLRDSCRDLRTKHAEAVRELYNLQKKLNVRDRKESVFGTNGSPSGNNEFKPNSNDSNISKKGGARQGHQGHGRRSHAPEDSGVITEECSTIPTHKPCCDNEELRQISEMTRSYDRLIPARIDHIVMRRNIFECANCHTRHYARPDDVLPRMAHSNSFLATAAQEFLVNGRTACSTANMLHIGIGVFFHMIDMVAGILKPLYEEILKDTVRQKVLYADETRWRTDGKKGYVWVFTNDNVVLYLFEDNRSSAVPAKLFGWLDKTRPLPESDGFRAVTEACKYELLTLLVTDRYVAYLLIEAWHQFCFEHLKRDLENLLAKSGGIDEVDVYAAAFLPLLRKSMHLCADKTLSDDDYYRQAGCLKEKMKTLIHSQANDILLQSYQNIWRKKEDSLFRWVDDREVCCENNRAERTLRKTVISRKISFGSQSRQGADNREIIMTVLHTAKARGKEPHQFLLEILNAVAVDKNYDVRTAMPPCRSELERKKIDNSS